VRGEGNEIFGFVLLRIGGRTKKIKKMKTLKFEKDEENGILAFRFSYDRELFSYLVHLAGFRYIRERKLVFIRDEPEAKKLLAAKLKQLGYEIREESLLNEPLMVRKESAKPVRKKKEISDRAREDLDRFKAYLEHRRYSASTVSTYVSMIETWISETAKEYPFSMEKEDVVNYVNGYMRTNNLSHAFQNQFISAARIFYSEIGKTNLSTVDLERPRREHKLPNILSMKEVKMILDSLTNNKHRMALKMIYAFGLRRSELLDLRIESIDRERGYLIVRQSKGKKDRYLPITEKIVKEIDEYLKHYHPLEYFIEGQERGSRYSETSLAEVFKKACKQAGIKKQVSLHTLRHCYATHLMERGTDIRIIQNLLGHVNIKTTEIYTHVSKPVIKNIGSPFDDLDNL